MTPHLNEIEYEFTKRMAEINELKRKIAEEGHKKEHLEREIKFLEGKIREMESRLMHTNRSEKVMRHEEEVVAHQIEHNNEHIRHLLRELDFLRSKLR